MVADNNLILKASAAITTTTTGTAIDLGTRTLQPLVFRATVSAGAADASEVLTLVIQDSANNSDFVTLVGFPAIDGLGVFYRAAKPRQYVRYYATVAGTTPSFTTAIDVCPAGRDNEY